MHKWLATFGVGVALMIGSGFGGNQDKDAESRWIDATSEKLARFLPDATSSGLTPEQYVFKGAANDTPHRYICVLAHQYWRFNDPDLSRQIDEADRQSKALSQEMEDGLKRFEIEHKAEIDAHQKRLEALQKQAEDLVKQGKYQEVGALSDKIGELQKQNPVAVYTQSFEKRNQEIADRKRYLSGRWRNVNFRLGTNRTLATAIPSFHLLPSGTLGQRPLFREQKLDRMTPDSELSTVALAVFLGPSGYQNPRANPGERQLAVKCIFVWAWLQSRPDTVRADEAIVRNILEKIDYNGLSKLVEP